MSKCTAGCATQDCPSYGACLKGKGVRTVYANSAAGRDLTREKAWQKELDLYASARKQGIQPSGTSTEATRAALDVSDLTGSAYNAEDN